MNGLYSIIRWIAALYASRRAGRKLAPLSKEHISGINSINRLTLGIEQRSKSELVDAKVREMESAMQRAVQQALWEHKQLGHHIIVWRDGKVVRLAPDEIHVEKPSDR
jgi:hypothetical protein